MPNNQHEIILTQVTLSSIGERKKKQEGWLWVFLGWLVTAITLGMGAPFWFDVPGKVMNVRNTVNNATVNKRLMMPIDDKYNLSIR